MGKPKTELGEALPEEIEDRGINLHVVIDRVVALSGRKVLTREYCQLMDILEPWLREYPWFAGNEDLIVRAGIRFLEGQDGT